MIAAATSRRPGPRQGKLFEVTRTHRLTEVYTAAAPARAHNPRQQAGARAVAPYAGGQRMRILAALAAAPDGLTREQLAGATGIKETSLCGRLDRLAYPNRKRPANLPALAACVRAATHTRRSAAGVEVTVYQITAAGGDLLSGASAQGAGLVVRGGHRSPRRRGPRRAAPTERNPS